MKNSIELKILILLIAMTLSGTINGQTIINTENMMSKIEGDWSFSASLEGDFNFGNIELIQFGTATQLAKRIDRHLIRGLFNYEYISEGDNTLSSDFTGQIRYNYQLNKNSMFAFIQAQNIKSLRMNHRYLGGGGYRQNLITKDKNYWDLSAGAFFEDEFYDRDQPTELQVYNWRYSLSSFSKIHFSEHVFLNTSIYYQINTKRGADYRLFFEPRLYYQLNKIDLYIDMTYRHHSTPYIDILPTDTQVVFGIEFSL